MGVKDYFMKHSTRKKLKFGLLADGNKCVKGQGWLLGAGYRMAVAGSRKLQFGKKIGEGAAFAGPPRCKRE